MLSQLVVTNQKIVLIVDELNRERIAEKFIRQLLQEQGQDQEIGSIQTLPTSLDLQHVSQSSNNNNNNSSHNGDKNAVDSDKVSYNVILPTLANLLCFQTPAFIFGTIRKLRDLVNVKRIFLWASPQYLQHPHIDYIMASLEYLSEIVLHLETETTLSLTSRKPGGAVSYKRYTCQVTKLEFHVAPVEAATEANSQANKTDASKPAADPGGTFKIELNEDEVVARNALTLPYERTSEPAEGNIIYTPDADDDFDDEDPDEDLCI